MKLVRSILDFYSFTTIRGKKKSKPFNLFFQKTYIFKLKLTEKEKEKEKKKV